MAKDYFINTTLNSMDTKGDIKMPPGGVADEKYLNWDWRRIYEDLKRSGAEGDSMDYHVPGGGASGGADQQELAKRKAQIDTALRQGKMLSERRRKDEGSDGRSLDLSELLYPKIRWQDQLSDFVTTQVSGREETTWRKPNRRFLAQDIYLPSMVEEALTKLVVVFDTSGSCFNSQEQVAFVSELASILDLVKPEKVVVLYVDTGVVGDQEFSDGQFAVADIDVRGGGGTDLEVAYDWIEKNGHADTQAVIFFTDGYTDFSNAPSYPVLWVMTTEELAPYGHNIRLTLE
jgi:predicted metal-dependent peptidase